MTVYPRPATEAITPHGADAGTGRARASGADVPAGKGWTLP